MKTKSLKWNVFRYLIAFSVLILSFIWIFQILFLKSYYELHKTNELEHTIESIKLKYKFSPSSLYETLEQYSYDRGICSEVNQKGIITYTTNPLNRGCLNIYNQSNKLNIENAKKQFLKSSNETFKLKIINEKITNKTLIYGIKLDNDTSVFVNTSIQPIDSTVTILKKQFSIITFIVIILAAIVAYFISNKLTGPIHKLTQNSKELSKGNFDISFNTKTEIEELKILSSSLDYTKNVLKQNDELRRDLMANVSHDLKTPLTMIKAYAEMVKDFSYKDKEKRNNDLNIIIDEVDRLNILVNDILELSKLESDIESLNLELFDLSKLITTIIERFKIYSTTEKFSFITRMPKETIIKADRQKIEQVIYNLIGNAINYTGDNKKIFINVYYVDKKIRVSISDIGKGIQAKELKNIWNKYYKTEKRHQRNTIGTGLGLSIVKHILELHDYEYGVITKLNKGTTFYFYIKTSI